VTVRREVGGGNFPRPFLSPVHADFVLCFDTECFIVYLIPVVDPLN
jgi:hypothetical protein